MKLFLLGLLTQGGTEFMNYDLRYLRLMGILQRVAGVFESLLQVRSSLGWCLGIAIDDRDGFLFRDLW